MSQVIQWERLFVLHSADALPLHARLRRLIVEAVLDGRLGAGAALPSSRELAARLGISRNTVTAAFVQLMDDGFLEARARSGVFVAPGARLPRAATLEPSRAAPPASGAPDWAPRIHRSLSGRATLAKPLRWRDYAYPFVYGTYDAELFPTEDFRECCARLLARAQLPRWAPDFDTDDVPDLVEQIRTRLLPQRGVFALPDEILVTVGTQHAYYLLAEALFDASTRVGLEEPGHPHARNSFALRDPLYVELAVDGQGLVVEAMPALDYAFVTPSHQSPTTATLSLERRHLLLSKAESEDFVVIEDDYEAENLHAGAPMPALKSLDRSGRVVYIGSVSKSLSPVLRLGYIVASRALVAELRTLRHAMVRHPSAFLQHAYALFLSLGHHESHARRVNAVLRERLEVAAAALRAEMPEVAFEMPLAGASLWLRAPAWVDAGELSALARTRGVLIEAGDVFFARPPYPCPYVRLRLSSIAATRIPDGIRALAAAYDELAQARGARPRRLAH